MGETTRITVDEGGVYVDVELVATFWPSGGTVPPWLPSPQQCAEHHADWLWLLEGGDGADPTVYRSPRGGGEGSTVVPPGTGQPHTGGGV